MKTEALIGKELGTSTLQRLLGHGTLGAVYLAQQSRPHRQVAVKVFVRAAALEPALLSEFLARFQHAVDAAAALEHPHILAIHQYGEHNKLAYMVMPYIQGGTLRGVLERDGALPLSIAADYLEQLAAALDYAHGKSIIHRDIKPGNILITGDGRLLLADFGLTSVVSEGKMAQVRLAAAGMLDYMAPEQVMGKKIDARADLYSLGVVLYHMVTGTAPFKGDTLMQVAVQHLQAAPPPPRSLRADLPPAAEQVILRAMARKPADRFEHAQDLASAFRAALQSTTRAQGKIHLDSPRPETPIAQDSSTQTRQFRSRGLFDPQWQTGAMSIRDNEQRQDTGGGRIFRQAMADERTTTRASSMQQAAPVASFTPQLSSAGTSSSNTEGHEPVTSVKSTSTSPLPSSGTTGALGPQNYEPGSTGTIKLTGPAKVVRVPVAGQPGQYMTGLLPVLPAAEPRTSPGKQKGAQRQNMRILSAVLLILFLVGSGIFWFAKTHNGQSQPTGQNRLHNKNLAATQTPDALATATAQAQATAAVNIILSDPLDQNIHNWLVKATGTTLYQFENGAYHITNNDPAQGAPAILPDELLTGAFGYALTMEEIKGQDTSINNAFGMILRASSQQKNGKTITTFYSFEVANMPGGEYQFWKYDNSQGPKANPWRKIWHHAFGREFHEGHGPKSINTFKIFANGKSFTLIINGKTIGTVQDSSFASGAVGMLVNQKGTEVAFSNLVLTRN